ncbi:hypothetical protein [Erythrobacter sp. HL-111]|uniref:hypothetical protein n=1 Tax=Erythrobacter sp. HL-111 TaxID=1798193 RepID=UPI0006DAC0A1|nr:hypothetical protein [Erythrobacter sp. HL-111]KPP95377.1 MAG: hypothetical protein HLUCCO15_01855 [Erythrobacteraceae bacterium HL-111]SDS67452.1 hypothetical protein SAMN04515621_2005 [Erythrobacter sp. HL-111]
MRLSLIPLVSLVVATTPLPLSAQAAPSPLAGQPTCAASLEKVKGASGYKMVRKCGKSASNSASLDVTREPVVDGSELAGGISAIVVSLFALGALAGAIIIATDDDDGDGGGGLDPASP